MQAIAPMIPTLAVATIFCLWQRVQMMQQKRNRLLRERVAYMLWCAANEDDA